MRVRAGVYSRARLSRIHIDPVGVQLVWTQLVVEVGTHDGESCAHSAEAGLCLARFDRVFRAIRVPTKPYQQLHHLVKR